MDGRATRTMRPIGRPHQKRATLESVVETSQRQLCLATVAEIAAMQRRQELVIDTRQFGTFPCAGTSTSGSGLQSSDAIARMMNYLLYGLTSCRLEKTSVLPNNQQINEFFEFRHLAYTTV